MVYISQNTRNKNWGTSAIEIISEHLQQELPGLRGFSPTNLKNMRIFYEEWKDYNPIRQLATAEIKNNEDQGYSIRQLATAKLDENINRDIQIRQLTTVELTNSQIHCFLKVGFTHHTEIISKVKTLEERIFYIEQCAAGFWSVEKLKYNLKSNLFVQKGKLQNNFKQTIEDDSFRNSALNSFKDELLLDFINITDPDEEPDERVLEYAIGNNIKKFIMALGTDF